MTQPIALPEERKLRAISDNVTNVSLAELLDRPFSGIEIRKLWTLMGRAWPVRITKPI